MWDESVIRRLVQVGGVGYMSCWNVWNVCAEIVRSRDHAISFNYFVYKYIEIVRIVGHKMSYTDTRINAKRLFQAMRL